MNLQQTHRAFYAVEQLIDAKLPDQRYYRVTARSELFTQNSITAGGELFTPMQAIILQSTWVKSMSENNRQSWRHW